MVNIILAMDVVMNVRARTDAGDRTGHVPPVPRHTRQSLTCTVLVMRSSTLLYLVGRAMKTPRLKILVENRINRQVVDKSDRF